MLAGHLRAVQAGTLDEPAVIIGDEAVTYGDLATRVEVLTERWRSLAGLRVAVALTHPAEHVTAVIALAGLRAHSFLAGSRDQAEFRTLAGRLEWNAVVRSLIDLPDAPIPPPEGSAGWCPNGGLVTLLTSGTTGTPKAATHTWETLASPVRRDQRFATARWLCAYPLNLYAGTQVMLQALLNWSTLVVPPSLDPGTVVRTMHKARVTHASGTPTFWRQLLLFAPREELRDCRLEQITMGGEAVTQPLLDQLAGIFPHTRLVHIYASTELGRLFSVSDRREGFPADFLMRPPERGVELQIVDDELMARSPHRMVGYDHLADVSDGASASSSGGWTATGDLVERLGDRVLFRGRKTDLINVGGRKVIPLTVESVLREAAGVGDIRVYGKGSSLAGQLVAADIVLAEGSCEEDVRREINRIARVRLAQHEVPRLVRVVDSIARNAGFKVVRAGVG
jgi:acyl-CoA synthetase (AMP-forming)/AMP-acid ligase II